MIGETVQRCLNCFFKRPYERTEPWQCTTCGIVHALPIEPQKFKTRGVRARAIELLDVLASQETFDFGIANVPGYGPRYSPERKLASRAIRSIREEALHPDRFLAAAQLLRSGWTGQTTSSSFGDLINSAIVGPIVRSWGLS